MADAKGSAGAVRCGFVGRPAVAEAISLLPHPRGAVRWIERRVPDLRREVP